MALRNAIMAALLDGESSGYDLAKRFDSSVANFWTATPQQLYRELDAMAEAGLVEARVVEQERRPNKRLFTLTASGRKCLSDFAAGPTRPTALRDELLVKVNAIDALGPDERAALREQIEARITLGEEKLAVYEQMQVRMLRGRTEAEYVRTARRIGPFVTLQRGITFERDNVRWGHWALGVLDARAARS